MGSADHSSQKLLELLGDGELHSGAAIAAALGVSRTAVWKQLERLRDLGLEIHGEAGQGYRIDQPYTALDAARIRGCLPTGASGYLASLETLWEVDSTNSRVLELLREQPAPGATVCLAEYQTAGRGRRGRRWMSPPGCGIWLSVGWTWEVPPRELPTLSLATGAVVAEYLDKAGATGVELKWPNDLLLEGGKLGGILIDVQGDSAGPLTAVVGLGLNLSVPAITTAAVAADSRALPVGLRGSGVTADRNELAAGLCGALIDMLQDYENTGFAPYRGVWSARDAMQGKQVIVSGGQTAEGIALGVSEEGYLVVATAEGEVQIGAGDVSLRAG